MDRSERAKRLREMLQKIAPQESIESLKRDPFDIHESLASLGEERAVAESRRANSAIEAIDRAEPSDRDLDALEAIILPRERPVVFIDNATFAKLPDPWTHLGTDAKLREAINNAIPSIGRVDLPNHPQLPYGGTGFVVGENMLMTNRHVAQLFASGLGDRGLNFISGQTARWDPERERNSPPTSAHALKVNKVLMIHPYWDMALLQVEGLPEVKVVQLLVRHPDDLVQREIAVIGYPARDSRSNLELQDRIFEQTYNVKRLQPGKIQPKDSVESFGHTVTAITHDASTLGGNSGSALVDVESGHVVGLHFAGIYLKANYAVSMFDLAADSRVAAVGLNFTSTVPATDVGRRLWDQASHSPAPRDESSTNRSGGKKVQLQSPELGTGKGAPSSTVPLSSASQEIRISIPLEVSVRLGRPNFAAGFAQAIEATGAGLEAISIDPDYSTREGYDPKFLGGGKKSIPLPGLTTKRQRDHAAVNESADGDDPHEFRYHHFSLVMNAKRRLAYFTAVNIDGSLSKRPTREKDRWIFDPRLPEDEQVGNEFYGRPFDRGHLVRRLDPAWGRSKAIVKTANDDTFHFTNCSPQHARFNEGKNLWAGLEDYVLGTADEEEQRISVFTGCIFEDDDPEYEELQIPKQFWKVMVFVKSSGKLSATGYIVSQKELLKDEGIEATAAEVARTFQVPIRKIESLTELSFNGLTDYDPLDGRTDTEALEPDQELTDHSQIVF